MELWHSDSVPIHSLRPARSISHSMNTVSTPLISRAEGRVPRIAVLMASFNGSEWLTEQVQSILCQVDVSVNLFVSDDGSTDGTLEMVAGLAAVDSRVHVSSNSDPRGYAAANFFHMIESLDLVAFDAIAFADQDDIWFTNKLIGQFGELQSHGADGVSSDVIARWASGREFYVRKSTPQRRFDYIFESPGPGCSMLITPRLFMRLRGRLRDANSPARSVGFHDWLTYAVARGSGWKWHIADRPTLVYRQHDSNEFGVNYGGAALLRRLARYASGRFARDCQAVLRVVAECAAFDGRRVARVSVLDILREGRRRLIHRVIVAMLFPGGLSVPESSQGAPNSR